MIVPNPAWLSAGAEIAIAAETGVAVFGKKVKDETPAAPAAAVRAVSLDAVLLFAGLVLLGMAMLASAVIIHHGLMAS